VKNTGSVAGTDVAQLYLRVTGASTEQPSRLLKGFQRVTLAPGESKHIDFKVGFDELSFVTLRGSVGIEPAHYDFYVGDSSLATGHVLFQVEADPKHDPTENRTPPTATPAPAKTGTPLPMTPAPATAAPATK
jgi:hypothetical protein